MATYYPKYYYKDAVGMAESSVKPVYHRRLIDFAVQAVNTSDIVNMLAVPAFTWVENCNYQTITTVTSASATFVIGSATASITYVSSAAAVAAGLYGVPAAISASTAQKWYAVKDDIQINTVATANMTAGQIAVHAMMVYPIPYTYTDVDGNAHATTFTDRNNWTTTAPVIP